MTLAAQIGWKLGAVGVGILLVAFTGIQGIARARHEADVVRREFDKLQTIERAGIHFSTVQAALYVEAPDLGHARNQLDEALRVLAKFQAQCDASDAKVKAITLQRGIAATVVQHLEQAREVLAQPQSKSQRIDQDVVVAYVGAAQRELNALVQSSTRLVSESHERSAAWAWAGTLAMVGMSVSVIVVVLLISLWQYRGVMGPLEKLRAGVHRIAAGDFSHRLDATGCTEFAALSEDFNRTASELHDLYAELEERIRIKSKQLARSEQLASVGCLAAAVAHEINNPLGIIVGYAESGLRISADAETPGSPEVTEALEIIRDEAFRGKKITTQLLALSRVSDEPAEPMSLAQVTRDVADMLRGLAKYADRRIEVVIDDGNALQVHASALEMKQAVLNIAINALDAVAPPNGVVTFEGRRDGNVVTLTIRDNGRGMTPEVLERVFEPFFSDRRSQGGEGVGLGMSITQAIVERHGGSLTVQHGVGQGSSFTITLPTVATVRAPSMEKSV